MKYKIFSNDELINTIIADEEFCRQYCKENGYTYEVMPGTEEINGIPIEPVEQLRADIDYIAVMAEVKL